MIEYKAFFEKVTGVTPYSYQQRLATEPWPDLLDIPTGLGKTAAIVLAWLYKRLQDDSQTPRRLVYCLPMRVLVEQTRNNAETWTEVLSPLFEKWGKQTPAVYTLMGGEADSAWVRHPEQHAILIGTQDMLLSRALMRGYGMSRYQWPVDFSLLHNDALWVYDEIQLMGPALATSSQLEAFRRDLGRPSGQPCRSIWASATLRADWLATVNFRRYQDDLRCLRLDSAETKAPEVERRLLAPKSIRRADTALYTDNRKNNYRGYLDALAKEITDQHIHGEQTLVIVNRVLRAQKLFERLRKSTNVPCLLLHSRFRPHERGEIERQLQQDSSETGRVIVATQAVEAGVDISSRVMFTELAPWSSLVQRLGRCNRAGEHPTSTVRWIDIDAKAGEEAPYDSDRLEEARQQLHNLADAAPASLPAITEPPPTGQVIRQRDFLALFNTDPDLSGFDVDVSPYIRDTDTPPLQLFWREFIDEPGAQPAPQRAELCPAGIGQVQDYLKKRGHAWYWDALSERWGRLPPQSTRPGIMLMLRASDGGYDPEKGFDPTVNQPVTVLPGENQTPASYGDDRQTQTEWQKLDAHLCVAAEQARRLCNELYGPLDSVTEAALWHDVGKAHPAFQNALARTAEPPEPETLWAKSGGNGRLIYGVYDEHRYVGRPYFRHELASMLAWLEHNDNHVERDLIAYLIAAHHGKVRMGLRALPGEAEPDDPARLFARGVWDGEQLPAFRFDSHDLPATPLRLELMRLGDGAQGPSWAARTANLLSEYGPFQLAWLETMVRVADWRASAL